MTSNKTSKNFCNENNQKCLNEIGATVLRISLGIMFLAHAHLKYFTFTLAGTQAFFASLGLPEFLANVVFLSELVFGVLLVLGVQTRYVALISMPILLGATWAHSSNGWVFSNTNGGWEYPVFLTVAAFVQALIGDGKLALSKSFGCNK